MTLDIMSENILLFTLNFSLSFLFNSNRGAPILFKVIAALCTSRSSFAKMSLSMRRLRLQANMDINKSFGRHLDPYGGADEFHYVESVPPSVRRKEFAKDGPEDSQKEEEGL